LIGCVIIIIFYVINIIYINSTELIHLCLILFWIDTIIFSRLCKSYSLPNGEIPKEPEHAINVVSGVYIYNKLQDKFNKVIQIIVCGIYESSMKLIHIHIFKLLRSDQSLNKENLDTLSQQERNYNTPKLNVNYQESTTRFPKERNLYGDGGLILGGKCRIQFNTKVIQLKRSYSSNADKIGINNLMKLNVQNGKYNNLYKLIYNKQLLELAYVKLKSNPGNMTPGIDNKTFDGINLKFMEDLMVKLKNETFKFTSVKRVYIPKSNGKLRPLGIPTIKDKLVQEMMRMILELIFEPTSPTHTTCVGGAGLPGKFSNLSHGLRPNRSCHTALKEVSKWNGITWFIEGDIKGFFDNVNHHILESILRKYIDDQQFIDLYWKLVRAGYVDKNIQYDTLKGVPQGGVISPILSNIYLNEFDTFMEDLINKYSSKEKYISKVNPKIINYSNKLTALHNKYVVSKDKEILKAIKKLRMERNELNSRIRVGTRIWYVRYADDWIIGIIGTKEIAIKLKELCMKYLLSELKIQLNLDKTKITHASTEKAKFLGVEIFRNVSKSPKIIQRIIKGEKRKSRINYARIYFYAPTLKLLDKLKTTGFIKTYTSKQNVSKLVPNAITKWIFLDHRSIVLRYNAVIRGLLNYYKFVDNFVTFHSIVNYFMHHSCAKTLARKYNLITRAKAFKKFGRYLTAPKIGKLKALDIYHLKSYKKNTGSLTNVQLNNYNPFEVLNWRLETQIGYYDPCWICGTEGDTQMHHVKHLRKDGKKPTGFLDLMSKLNRKQIPVCTQCHLKIHKGLLNHISLKDLKRPEK